jgi:protein transport protein SEC24
MYYIDSIRHIYSLSPDAEYPHSRTKVGIITFDTAIQFYNLNRDLGSPHMVVVSDLEDLFLPLVDDILLPLEDNQDVLCNLLDSIPNLFRETKVTGNCLGSGLISAFLAQKHIGGKICLFSASLPTMGHCQLNPARDKAVRSEIELLRQVRKL